VKSYILVNGKIIKNRGKESKYGPMVLSMKDVGKIIFIMEKAG
jgi:hypothetical protein